MAAKRSRIQTLYNTDFVVQDGADPHFSLDGEVGLLLATGNTDATSVKASLAADHETHDWSNIYFAEMLYKEVEKNVNGEKVNDVAAERYFAYGQFDYKLGTPGRRMFMYGDYENDRFNGYNYRASLAGGWSHRLWRDEDSEFRYSVGPGYAFVSAEEEKNDNLNDGVIVRASAEYKFQWATGAKFRQFVSMESGEDNTKSRSETSLSANLFGSLAMKLALKMNHETSVLEAAEKLNTETSVSLVYQFF
ncbi:DUF481 domain-containing protein [Alteromonas aestuariivivens]|uniref:DUF481 domain-containing protein n=2 Tax=Alteromonas aestuariivivens TaxID=1938339 RepID=A0A3D8MEW9_9ALTE|nr:DUF481 domain-containing protein [Alteromonas aestuariivivens]